MKLHLLLLATIVAGTTQAQKLDSTKTLNEVKINAYLGEQILISLPATATIINKAQLEQRTQNTLLPALNSISGVKMEERSPGSYRLSIRGSLIRSPFGVRNVKVYYDDFPLTDAGGNTYLNLIDQNTVKGIEILKGPDGSLFGANSGGVVLINSSSAEKTSEFSARRGSFGLFGQHFGVQNQVKNYEYSFNQAYQEADGYRINSTMRRLFVQTQQKWKYNQNGTLKFSGFYADMNYNTPGGLTELQLVENPRAARARAEELNTGIYNKSVFLGLSHDYKITNSLRHYIGISGLITDFKNPFFTNYEFRDENSYALRTYLELKNKETSPIKLQWNLGYEYQRSKTDFMNYGNQGGNPTTLRDADEVKNFNEFIFNRLAIQLSPQFKAEASVSLNFNRFNFRTLPQSPQIAAQGNVNFDPTLMPKLALSYLVTPHFSVRALVSKGYATPTKDEIRPSNRIINTSLNAEEGWNYEAGFRFRTRDERIYADVSAFYYRLDNAIVRRVNANDEDFYVNAGGTNQLGAEIQLNANIIKSDRRILKSLDYYNAITISKFEFRDYIIGSNNFSGNMLTGIPKLNWVNGLNLLLFNKLNLFVQHQYNSKTSLNDAETVFADSFHLIQSKLNYIVPFSKVKLHITFAVDNLLNEKYSLGNDINAFGNRYFNPAATRNYYAGLALKW